MNAQGQTVLDVVIAKRLTSQGDESDRLDDILRFLVSSGVVEQFDVTQAYRLYQLTLRQNHSLY